MTTLSERALLVNLRVSQWSARRLDKRETAAVAIKHGTVNEVARVNKNLLPFAADLERIHKRTGSIRTEFYKRTLPWSQEGVQILKADAYIDFTRDFRGLMDEWRSDVDEFVGNYPTLREEAKLLLNSLYDEADYPEPEDVRRKFNIDMHFYPIPDRADWRVSVGDAEMQELQDSIEERVKSSVGEAMRDAWKRVYDTVSKAHERLADPKAIFRDSLVENAVELCKLLPSLNLTDDPDLETMRKQLEGTLCRHNPDTLRSDPRVRSDAAAKMVELMGKMGAFYRE